MKLYRALLLARATLGAARRAELDRELARVVNVDTDAVIRLDRSVVDRRYREYESNAIPVLNTAPGIGVAEYRGAKRRLLELSRDVVK